jgi:L-ribulose-5-phosphate 4-epimerase
LITTRGIATLNTMKDGVTKFKEVFTPSAPIGADKIITLDLWRRILRSLNLLGQNPEAYDGAAYGNVSQRIGNGGRNRRKFIITGRQTSGLETATNEQYAIVLEYYPEQNLIVSEGPVRPSSESMTHGALYDLDSSLQFVFHVHSGKIWRQARLLNIPATKEAAEYGTIGMVEEIRRLFRESDARFRHILAMGGHEDGIIAFGRTAEEAGITILRYLTQVRQFPQEG